MDEEEGVVTVEVLGISRHFDYLGGHLVLTLDSEESVFEHETVIGLVLSLEDEDHLVSEEEGMPLVRLVEHRHLHLAALRSRHFLHEVGHSSLLHARPVTPQPEIYSVVLFAILLVEQLHHVTIP